VTLLVGHDEGHMTKDITFGSLPGLPLHQSYSGKEQVILNRLLIGHGHLTQSYLLNNEQPPNCDYCRSPLTVEYFLTSCSAYKNIRPREKYHHSQLTNFNQYSCTTYI